MLEYASRVLCPDVFIHSALQLHSVPDLDQTSCISAPHSALVAPAVVNFPDDRGSVIGVLKAFHGMSASVYATAFW
jgi:hypothetical protein